MPIDFNFYWIISESDLEESGYFDMKDKVYSDMVKAYLLRRYDNDFACIDSMSWKNIFVFLEVVTKYYRKTKDIIKKLESEVIHEMIHGLLELKHEEEIAHGLTMLLMNTIKYNYLLMTYNKPIGLKLFTENLNNCIILEG